MHDNEPLYETPQDGEPHAIPNVHPEGESLSPEGAPTEVLGDEGIYGVSEAPGAAYDPGSPTHTGLEEVTAATPTVPEPAPDGEWSLDDEDVPGLKESLAGSGEEADDEDVELEMGLDPNAPPSSLGNTSISPRHKVEAWLAEMVRLQASDLILRAGGKPSCRVDGRIHFLPGRVPGAGPLLEVLEGVMGADRMGSWSTTGSVDTALQLDGLGRFRLNAYRQMGEPALVMRRIDGNPPMLSTLCLPTVHLERLALRKRGIVLVTGIAGSGKSTTLAAMLQYMNTHAERHVITLEDPVEMIFTEDRCVISQREVGTDCPDFQDGLRHALRQSPDCILIGEMRDAETVMAALDATETGHLVFSTLHTVNAPQTVDRILSFFKSEQHAQVRQRLADNLAAVLSQRLLPRKSGTGMVPAVELMLSTPRIRELLNEGATQDLSRVIESGGEEDLISFNMSLKTLVEHDLVELEVALAASDRPEELLLALRGFSQGSQAQRRGPLRLSGAGGGQAAAAE